LSSAFQSLSTTRACTCDQHMLLSRHSSRNRLWNDAKEPALAGN
jgi:hypothetical protein